MEKLMRKVSNITVRAHLKTISIVSLFMFQFYRKLRELTIQAFKGQKLSDSDLRLLYDSGFMVFPDSVKKLVREKIYKCDRLILYLKER